jgi:hypothetical protein
MEENSNSFGTLFPSHSKNGHPIALPNAASHCTASTYKIVQISHSVASALQFRLPEKSYSVRAGTGNVPAQPRGEK